MGVIKMENKINDALENIFTIKKFIGQAKTNCRVLSNILMFLGVINLIYFGTTIIGGMILEPYEFQGFYNITIALKTVMYILFFVYFIKVYREEKVSSNRYYLSFLSILIGVTVLLPLLIFIIRNMFDYNVPIEKVSEFLMNLQWLSTLSNILLFCFSMIVCGYIIRKKRMIFTSGILLFLYLITALIYNNVIFTIGLTKTPSSISLSELYYCLTTSIGYIIIATILKYGVISSNGDK